MDNAATLYWGMLFGAIGLGYLTYGRRQRAAVPLVIGIALIGSRILSKIPSFW